MKCLIIAAGRGSRLQTRGDTKPLILLLGLTLIERVILAADRAGLNDFYVVTGHNGEKVRSFLDEFARRRNVSITQIINEEWEKKNGISVLKAKEVLNENFVLLMMDHIFDELMLARLKEEELADDEVMLAVDRNTGTNTLVDVGEVTRVLVEEGGILGIGKNIEKYNAYDTGIFLCSPAIFGAIEESVRNGDSSLTGAIKVMSGRRKARAYDIKDGYWIDIDDEKDLKKAENMLLASLRKGADGPVSRFLNRPVSARITKQLLKTGIAPNHISIISLTLAVSGALFFFLSGHISLIIGAILVQLSSIIDGCDGEIARLKFKITEFGGWFDAVLDRYADAFLLFGLTCHGYVYYPNWNWNLLTLFIGFLAIIGSFMNSYMADKYDGLMRRKLGPGRYYFRLGRDVRMFIIFLGALMNLPVITLAVIAFLMNAENIRRVMVLYGNAAKK